MTFRRCLEVAVQHHPPRCGVVLNYILWYGMLLHGMVLYCTVWYGIARYGMEVVVLWVPPVLLLEP